MFQQGGDLDLHLFQLLHLEVGIRNGKHIAGLTHLVHKHAAIGFLDLFLHFKHALAFEHHSENVAGFAPARIAGFDQLPQEPFGIIFLNRLGWCWWRGFVSALPSGDKSFARRGPVAFLFQQAVQISCRIYSLFS